MKVILNDNKIAFTSDLHINHRKLCTGYENHFDRTRKYVTVEEMNEDIVRRWNDTVDDETTVFFLGDFTLGTPAGKLVDLFREYYVKLKFKHMYWLMGNHDYEIFKRLAGLENEFPRVTFVRDKYILLVHDNINYLLQHYTFDDIKGDEPYRDSNPDALNQYDAANMFITYLVHGHTHESCQAKKCRHGSKTFIQNNVNWESYYRPVRIHELCPKDDGKTLIIVRGIPGSGKSTYARRLAENLRAQGHAVSHFEADDFWMTETGEYRFRPELLGVAHRQCYDKVFNALAADDSHVIVSNTFVKRRELKPYLVERGYRIVIYRMANDFGSIHRVPRETVSRMKESFIDCIGETIVKSDT